MVLAGLARWPVTISYFEVGKDSATPAYAISFELYENGVSRSLVVDYGEFALRGMRVGIESTLRAAGRVEPRGVSRRTSDGALLKLEWRSR